MTDHKDELVDEAVFSAIRRVNLKRQLDFTPIQRFTILPIDFSLKGGELGMFIRVLRYTSDMKRPADFDFFQLLDLLVVATSTSLAP